MKKYLCSQFIVNNNIPLFYMTTLILVECHFDPFLTFSRDKNDLNGRYTHGQIESIITQQRLACIQYYYLEQLKRNREKCLVRWKCMYSPVQPACREGVGDLLCALLIQSLLAQQVEVALGPVHRDLPTVLSFYARSPGFPVFCSLQSQG